MNDFLQTLATPLQYDYMLRAIWVSAWVGGVCGLLSSFVTMKGWALMGDALSHAVVPGVAIAYIVGFPFVIGAFIAGILATAAMTLIRSQSKIREDATMGIVFSTFFALGLLLISLFPSGLDLKVILYGNILAIADHDLLQVLIISLGSLLVIALKWRDFMLYCFDPNQAKTLGLNTGFLHILLLSILAAATVAALQAVGAILVIAMLITPGATAYLLTDRFGKMLGLSAAFGVTTSILGAYISYFINGASGGCIVTLQTLCFLIAFFFAPKRGMLTQRLTQKTKLSPTES